jgi:DNA-binding protein HU-beta
VLLTGFGCFRVVERKARRGADPRSGRPITIAGRKAVKFKPAKRWESL